MRKKKQGSALEEKFFELWLQLNPDLLLAREVRLIPTRRFRFDFVHPESRVAIEIQGGTYSRRKLGHNSGSGIRRDYEKSFLVQIEGWNVFHLDCNMSKNPSIIGQLGMFIRVKLIRKNRTLFLKNNHKN